MAYTRVDYSKILESQKVLIDLDEEYEIKVINGNYELISKLFKHKTKNVFGYTTQELNFITSVKRYVLKNEIHLREEFQENQLFSEDVHFVRVQKVPVNKIFENVCEVDIDQAYWETAHQLGIISDDLYRKGSKGNISKQARLTALGSFAKKVYRYKFKGKKVQSVEVDKDELLENLWFTICKRVSDVMHKVIEALGDDFIFYWVDGIYFNHTEENVNKVMGVFLEGGYNSKFKKINQIHFHEKGFTVNDYGELKRNFNYPRYSEAGKKIDYSENFRLADMANDIVNSKTDLLKNIKKKSDNNQE
jgi:hypothetical protein